MDLYGSCFKAGTMVSPWDIIYFSYSSFTTLVYGDVVPVGWCRHLSVISALSGYVLLGIFIASLINKTKGT
ncbi:ion channel [Limimaricola sp. AA108-03]|uniref:ion channel n=1 Tax=Limimaricola sp. AA108-03 TaxID=3425945 RepID=UPI003D781839